MEWVTFVPFPMPFTFMRSLSWKRIYAVPFPVLAAIFITARRCQVLPPSIMVNCLQLLPWSVTLPPILCRPLEGKRGCCLGVCVVVNWISKISGWGSTPSTEPMGGLSQAALTCSCSLHIDFRCPLFLSPALHSPNDTPVTVRLYNLGGTAVQFPIIIKEFPQHYHAETSGCWYGLDQK